MIPTYIRERAQRMADAHRTPIYVYPTSGGFTYAPEPISDWKGTPAIVKPRTRPAVERLFA